MILERAIQKVANNNYDAYIEYERKWEAIEQRIGGFPPKCHYMAQSGTQPMGTIIWQREWPDMATCEAMYEKLFSDEETKGSGNSSLIVEEWREYYYNVEQYLKSK